MQPVPVIRVTLTLEEFQHLYSNAPDGIQAAMLRNSELKGAEIVQSERTKKEKIAEASLEDSDLTSIISSLFVEDARK